MDNIMQRSRYPRTNYSPYRRKKPGYDKKPIAYTIIRQAITCILILLIVLGIKNINFATTNYLTEKIKHVIEKNYELKNVAGLMDGALAFLQNKKDDENKPADEDIESNILLPAEHEEDQNTSRESSVLAITTENVEEYYDNLGEYQDIEFIVPVEGEILYQFGENKNNINDMAVSFNEGIDIAAQLNSNVKAAADGLVIDTGTSSLNGKFLKIMHENGLVSVYSNCSDIYVVRGQRVLQGDIIGSVGESEDYSGVYLHFEIRKDGSPLDPLNYVKFSEN
jgi:murein DD-endopeptidase MepM/ murein hydrolase activator NlpD